MCHFLKSSFDHPLFGIIRYSLFCSRWTPQNSGRLGQPRMVFSRLVPSPCRPLLVATSFLPGTCPTCHRHAAFLADLVDADCGQLLAMSLFATIHLSALELENDYFRAFLLFYDGPGHRGTGNRRAAYLNGLPSDEQHSVKIDLFTSIARQLLDLDQIARLDPILLTTCLNDCVQDTFLLILSFWKSVRLRLKTRNYIAWGPSLSKSGPWNARIQRGRQIDQLALL